jgi:Ca-activated chloride channel family protein
MAAAPSAAPGLGKRTAWQPQTWHKLQLVCLLASFLIFGHRQAAAAEDIGAGTLTFTAENQQSFDAPRLHTEVQMKITGIVARVEVHQRFENPGEQWVEGVYAFPLPENSAVDRLRMTVGERVIVGEIHEKVEAQQLYEQAKASGRTASLVQQHRANLFRTSVANIGPHEVIDVTIGYLQIVDQDAERYSLRFPLTITPRYTPGTTVEDTLADEDQDLMPPLAHADPSRQSVSINVDIDAGVQVGEIGSAYHEILKSEREGRYSIRLAEESIPPDHDFELAWTPIVLGEPATALFREKTVAGEHVLLMFMPPQEHVSISTPREVIFVIDTSGSMSGESIGQAQSALLNGLSTLTPLDRFTVIEFNSYVRTLFPQTVRASADNIDRARSYVARLRANGGTEMLPAMKTALTMPTSGEFLRQVVFMTDGAIGNEDELMSEITADLGDARLFIVGIGSAPNGAFMRKAAQMGRGTFTYIGATSEVDERMSGLLRKLQHPVLTDIQLHWPNGISPEYAPSRIGDLYSGEPIVVTARVQNELRGTLTVSGLTTGPWTRQIDLDQRATREGIATLWARSRVGELMDQRARNVDDETIRSQVLPLALQYGLVTQYTSLVAVDRTPVRPVDEALESRRIANTKPQGSNWPAAGMPKTATSAELQMLIGIALMLLAAGFATFGLHRDRRA